MTIHSWPLQISAISVASYFHVYTCFIAKVFLHGLNFSNCILGRFRYQLFKLPVTFHFSQADFSFCFLHWVPGTCSFLGAHFLQRRCFWGGYHSFLSVIDSTFGLKGDFFGNEQLTLMQNIILESQ